jgi:hypothetical protein
MHASRLPNAVSFRSPPSTIQRQTSIHTDTTYESPHDEPSLSHYTETLRNCSALRAYSPSSCHQSLSIPSLYLLDTQRYAWGARRGTGTTAGLEQRHLTDAHIWCWSTTRARVSWNSVTFGDMLRKAWYTVGSRRRVAYHAGPERHE